MSGITSAEFLSIIPKKDKEDHERDKKEMKKVSEKLREITLNPKMDLEEAIKLVRVLEGNVKKKRLMLLSELDDKVGAK
jgi:hypothetical protein